MRVKFQVRQIIINGAVLYTRVKHALYMFFLQLSLKIFSENERGSGGESGGGSRLRVGAGLGFVLYCLIIFCSILRTIYPL